MAPITGNTVAYETPAAETPHDMAVRSIEERVVRQFVALTGGEAARRAEEDRADPKGADDRKSRYEEQDRRLINLLRDRAVAVYEDACERRGDAQAAADAMSGAIGLPVDPEARQAEIERREAAMNAQHRMQMGQGEQSAIMDGSQMNPNSIARIDQATPGPTHPFMGADRRGMGENIIRQIADVHSGMVDTRTGERFDTPQPHLVARMQGSPTPPPPSGESTQAGPTDEQKAHAADVASGKNSPLDNVKGYSTTRVYGVKAHAGGELRNDDRARDLLRRARQLREEPRG